MEEQNQQQAPQQSLGNIDRHKTIAIIGYIIPILFFIPLLSDAKYNAYAKFHTNQQLNLLLFYAVGFILSPVLAIFSGVYYLAWLFYFLFLAYKIAGTFFMILGIINALKGEMKKLPIIGGFELIK